MLNRTKSKFALIASFLLLVVSGTFAIADDMEDAKNAYGAGQFEEAATLLRPLVRQENIEATYLLARMYEQGDGVEKDLEEAKNLFRIAAQNGNEAAQQRLDIFDAQGADDSVVIEWYLPSAEEGDTEAQYNLGFMYETGWGVLVNEKNAVRWYREAAEMQHDVAQLRLGMMLIIGVGVTKSINDGLTLLRRSAENGNRISEALVQNLFDASDVQIDDAVRIVAGIRRVLDEGEKQTLETLHRSLELLHKKVEPTKKPLNIVDQAQRKRVDIVKAVTGKNVSATDSRTKARTSTRADARNLKESQKRTSTKKTERKEKLQLHDEEPTSGGNLFHWYLNNANQGEADSQYHAGVMYVRGDQVGRDVDEGVRWIKLAAEQGHEMAIIYMKLWEDEFSFDSSVAVRWLQDAGRNFDLNAIFNLAFLYETGRGVPKNFNTATQWYKFAAVEGHAEAKRRLASLKKNNSSTDEIASTQNVEVEPDFPVIVGLLLVLLACVGGYFYYQRQRNGSVSVPVMDGGDNEVISQAKNVQGLQVDDRKFFDELWESSSDSQSIQTKPARVEKNNTEANRAEKKPDADSSKVTSKTESIPDSASDSDKLSIVEQKLAKAIDELMIAGKAGNTVAAETAALPSKEKKATEKPEKAEIAAEKAVKPKVEESKSVTPVERVPASVEAEAKKSKEKVSGAKIDASEFDADSFLNNGISMDELAVSRISADNLFADGVAIDEAGKAVGRGGYNPQKLNAEDMLKFDGLSSDNSISISSISKPVSKSRPVGPAASLLPKQNEEISLVNKDISSHIEVEVEAVDVSAPMTNNEERSLAEVHFNIGVMFSAGDGVPQNKAQAAKWFLKAAEEGLPEAQFNIGQCYLTGSGVQKDSSLAMKWIQKAADEGFKPAQEELQKKNRSA